MKAVAVVLVVLVIAGCGGEDEDEADSPQAAPTVEDCGAYESLNAPPTAEEGDKNRCLVDAFEAGRRAKLTVTLATVEGDPITNYLTVGEDGELEVLVDGTKDEFGSGTWEAYTCTGLSEAGGRLSWEGCREMPVPKDVPLTNPQPPS